MQFLISASNLPHTGKHTQQEQTEGGGRHNFANLADQAADRL